MRKVTVKRPLFISALAVALCAASGVLFGIAALIAAAVISALLCICFLKSRQAAAVASILITLYVLSFVACNFKINTMEKFCSTNIDLLLTAQGQPVSSGAYTEIPVISADNGKFPKNKKFLLYSYDSLNVSAGDVFSARVRLVSADDGVYKYGNYSNGIYYKMKLVEYGEKISENKFYKTLSQIRAELQDRLFLNMSYGSASTLSAVTYGEKQFLSDDFKADVRNAGVSHVMVVSGMHLAIIMGAVFKVLDKIFYNRFLKAVLSVAAVFMISGVCGFTMSIMRAGIMYIISALAPVFYSENEPVNSLGAAVCIVLIAMPYSVCSVSFQLSVLATYAVVGPAPFYTELLCRRINKNNFLLTGLISITVNTLCAMIMTMPISVWRFSSVSLIGPLTNIAISYPVTWALDFTLAALIISSFGFLSVLSAPLFSAADFFTKYINIIISDFGEMKYSAVNTEKWIAIPAALLAFLISAFVYICNNKQRKKRLKEDLCGRSF